MILSLYHCFFVYSCYKVFLFQKLEDYVNMFQAVMIYLTFACGLLLICWFGTKLTQHVRVNGILLLLFLSRQVENAERFQQIRNLELLSVVDRFL